MALSHIMEEKLAQIQALLNSKKILYADISIPQALQGFTQTLPSHLDEQKLQQIESALLGLFKVNNGCISPETAIGIGQCLVSVYQLEKSQMFWNLSTAASNSPTPASLFALGYVIRKIGKHSRSSLISHVRTMIGLKDPLVYPSLYVLRAIAHVCGDLFEKSINEVYNYAKKYVYSQDEIVQIASVQLVSEPVFITKMPMKKLLQFADYAFKYSKSYYLDEEISNFIAKCATLPYLNNSSSQDNSKEFSLQHQQSCADLKSSFQVLSHFQTKFSIVFKHFIEILEPSFVFTNVTQLFNFAMQSSPNDVGLVINLFSRDIKIELLKSLNTHQLHILKDFVCDNETAKAVISLIGNQPITQDLVLFYGQLARDYPSAAIELVRASVSSLAGKDNTDTILLVSILMSQLIGKFNIQKEVDLSQIIDIKKNPSYLYLLAVLPSSFSKIEIIDEAIADLTKKVESSKQVNGFDAAALFLSTTELDVPSAKHFCEVALKVSTPSFPTLISLLKLAGRFQLNASSLFINALSNLSPTYRTIKSFIPGTIPPAPIFFNPQLAQASSLQNFPFGASDQLLKLLEVYPKIFQASDLPKILKLSNRKTAFLAIIAVYKNKESASRIPANFHETLIKLLSTENEQEMVSECISYHALRKPETASSILSAAIEAKHISLLVSLVRHIQMADSSLSQIMQQITINEGKVNDNLFLLQTIYESKSLQLTSLLVGDQACQTLLQFLTSPASRNLNTRTALVRTVDRLIPVLLPFLSDPQTTQMLGLLLTSLQCSPLPYSKLLFFILARGVIAFASNLIDQNRLEYREKMTLPTKLAACGALADSCKVKPYPSDTFQLAPNLLILLQRSNDDRPMEFLVNSIKIDRPFSPEQMKKWFRMAKQILSENSMPGFGTFSVQPTTIVKKCALKILVELLPSLVSTRPLVTDCLDDLMTSAIRAIETKNPELHTFAYPLLMNTVKSFKNYKTDNGSLLLDVYESQLFIASRYSFLGNLDISADFAVSYLEFIFETNRQSTIMLLDTFVEGLQTVGSESAGFFSVASKIVSLVKSEMNLIEHFNEFLRGLTVTFESFVINAIKTRTNRSKWTELSLFRSTFSNCYSDILTSFVWLMNTYPSGQPTITIDTFVSFLILELTTSSESWRIYAAFSSLTSLIQLQKIEKQTISTIIRSIADVSRRNSSLLRPIIPNFLDSASTIIGPGDDWQSLSAMSLLTSCCSAKTLTRLLTNPSFVSRFSCTFVSFIVKMIDNGTFSSDEGIALMGIIFSRTVMAIPAMIGEIMKSMDIRFKMSVMRSAIAISGSRIMIDKVSDFVAQNVGQGGLDFVKELMPVRREIALEILARGVADKAAELVPKSVDLAMDALEFFDAIGKDCIDESARVAVEAIARWGSDKKQGKNVCIIAAKIIAKSPNASKVYGELDMDKREKVILNLTKFAKRKEAPKKLTLMTFSTAGSARARKQEDDEWQTLEIA